MIRLHRLAVVSALLGALVTPGAVRADGSPPFQIPQGDLVRIDSLVADAVAGSPASLNKVLRRDPFFRGVAKDLAIDDAIAQAAAGRFQAPAFLARSRPVLARYIKSNRAALLRRFDVAQDAALEVMLETKLESLATYLDQAQAQRKKPRAKRPSSKGSAPRASRTVRSVFGRRSRTLGMAPVESPHLVRGSRAALGQYAWLLAPKGRATAKSSARIETGRATYAGDVPLAGSKSVSTEVLLKGVGPTPYAGNVFNSKKTGSFPLEEGKQDWANTLVLKKAGIPVYEPVALIGLPYWEFSKGKGFKPLGIYARMPQENLRVSDLGILKAGKRRQVADRLRHKIAALSKTPVGDVSRADVIRFFAARMGRVSGLFEGGKTFGGKRYFHGMLHLQNISLLGEIVNLGHNEGLVSSEKALAAVYKKSGYTKAGRNWPSDIRKGATEKAVFDYMVTAFAEDLGEALPVSQRPSKAEIRGIFERAYREGRKGERAASTKQVLRSATRAYRTAARQKSRLRSASTRARTRRPAQQQRRRPAQRTRARSNARRVAR